MSNINVNDLYKYDPSVDGFSQSLLITWMKCPAMARAYLKGLYKPGFSKALMFGSVYHAFLDVMVTHHKEGKVNIVEAVKDAAYVIKATDEVLLQFTKELEQATISERDLLMECVEIAQVMLVYYFDYWKDDFTKGTSKKHWIALEEEFKVPIMGSFFRGKIDGLYSNQFPTATTTEEELPLYLFETKTKSRIDEDALLSMIPIEFQVLSYSLAMYLTRKKYVKGVLYNVIRSPQLRQGAKESFKDFLTRIGQDVAKRKDWYFNRYYSGITEIMIQNFSYKFSKLVLDFLMWVQDSESLDINNTSQCINIYGSCGYLNYCTSEKTNYSGLLLKEDKLFSELA